MLDFVRSHMAKNSHIEWTNHTFNPWWGCHKISPACDNCYAEAWAKRVGEIIWGQEAPRRFFGDAHWRQPLKWDQEAATNGIRARVFCASMADVFERRTTLDRERARLWNLIERTPNLDWLLLTKRPQYILSMTPWSNDWPPNVWVGTSIENQKLAELRLPYLLSVPAAVRFLSCEPLLGPLDLRPWFNRRSYKPIDWVIVGGESGSHSRPMHPDWVNGLLHQCLNAQVAFHFKQWGHWMPTECQRIADQANVIVIADERPIAMKAVGKKIAGRVLHGTTWNGLPELDDKSPLHIHQREVGSTVSKVKDREHFEDYREQTQVKHSILAAYLPAYYHILKASNRNLVYIDGFAGPGSYVQTQTGKTFDGSPILALRLIASNPEFSTKVSTVFIESDKALFNQLKLKVDNFYNEHPTIRKPLCRLGTFAEQLNNILNNIPGNLAPTFLFVDPCGVSGASFETIRTVMDHAKCEAFIFFNMDGVRRILGLPELSSVLVELMGSKERAVVLHNKLQQTSNVTKRETLILSDYCKALSEDMGVKYIIPFRVESEDQRRTSHYLIHASKHPLGFRIMKYVMWRRGHGEDQPGGLELLQKSRTNFIPMFDKNADVKAEILNALRAGPVRVSVFYEEWTMQPTDMQCEAAYRQSLLELENEGRIEVLGKDRRNVVSAAARPNRKGKPTLAKDYYVRLKN